MPEVIALAGALAHAGEHGESTVLRRNVADQLKNDDRLTDARAAIRANLSTTRERRDQVDDLQAGFQHLRAGFLLIEGRRLAVNRPHLLRGNVAEAVERLAQHIEETAQGGASNRHGNWLTRIDHLNAAL